eukprot:scaffold317_cov260-Pinguiococcus_pyrenoidosus.AAC.21
MPIDFVRMLPIACNPIPPPFGLAIPLIACLFPRVLLTHQFYSEDEVRRGAIPFRGLWPSCHLQLD